MSDTLTTLSLITLAQEYRGDVVRQINRRCVALKTLNIVPGSGKNTAWAPELSGQVAENYSEGADAANFGSDGQASAVLNWGLYRANFHVSSLAMDAAAGASSPVGDRALWARNLVNASTKLADTIEGGIFTGAGTGTLICGFDAAIGSTSNTYAGIDRSDSANAYWRPFVSDPGSATALTFAQIRSDLATAYGQSGEAPDLAYMGPQTFNKLASLFDPTRRIINFNGPRGKVDLEWGYGAVEVDGCVFVKAKDATEGKIYYVNSQYVDLEYLPAAQSALLSEMMPVAADDGFGAVPLGFTYEKLAKTGASEKAMVRSSLQLKVRRPNACGVRKNVAYS